MEVHAPTEQASLRKPRKLQSEESAWHTLSRVMELSTRVEGEEDQPMVNPGDLFFRGSACSGPEIRPSVQDYFVNRVQVIDGVQEVYHKRDIDGERNFWVVGDDLTREDKFDIYEIEMSTMKQYPDEELDFRVIHIPSSQDVSEIPSSAKELYTS